MTDQEKLMQQLKDALVAIKKLKADLAAEKYSQHEPIAIIGMAMRFPGNVKDEESFWELLSENKDAITEIPASRFDVDAYYDSNPDIAGKIKVRKGGFLEDIDKFDGDFYDITPAELENVDPQQRFLLELTHEALESSGMDVKKLEKSKTGVFCGVTNVDYQKKHFRSGDFNLINHYAYTGSAVCAHAGRLSYLLGLQGPSLSIDTACSSSLVAVHLATQSLRRKESSIAIVGACNLILEPELTMYFSHLNGLSEDGRCRPFADNANGFVRAEGAAVIVLERLSDAVAQKRNILGIIKGSAVNQDGRSNGFTAPDVGAQTRLLQDALKDAGISPKNIDYIEAHGTGTKIGDPIEFEAIANIYSKEKSTSDPLWIGSVKSNIGHTESVAGLAGIIKLILAFKKKSIPATLHFDKPNTLIDWQNTPVKVVAKNLLWDKENRVAGVSGFGVTGTNAHIIIAEPPLTTSEQESNISLRDDIYILPVYAKSIEALRENTKAMSEFINNSKLPLEDVCANAVYHRTPFNYRNTFVAKDLLGLQQSMEFTVLGGENETLFDDTDEIRTIFVFPGQGTQWKGMALQLAQCEPKFKETLEECAASVQKIVAWNLWDELQHGELERIDIVQPILVAVQIALAKLWQNYGVMPDGVIGHSMGEISAAYIAGKINMDDAFSVICNRSKLMHTLSGKGEMLATDLTAEEVEAKIQGHTDEVSLAVVNSLNSTVISGNPETLQKIATEIENLGRFAKKIKVDVASHSPQMDTLLSELKALVSHVQPVQGDIEFLSTAITGYKGNLDAEYWTKNLRNTVQFGKTLQAALNEGETVFLEMSPHPTLIHAIDENIQDNDAKAIALPTLYREKDELISFFTNFGKLHNSGYKVDWTKIYAGVNHFVSLPRYAWQKQRYWFDTKPKFTVEGDTANYFYTTECKKVEEQSDDSIAGLITLSNQRLTVMPTGFTFMTHDEMMSSMLNTVAIAIDIDDETANVISALQHILKTILTNKNIKRTLLITKYGVVFDEKDILNTTSAVLFGASRSIAHEHPELNLSRIDTDDFSKCMIPVTTNYKDIIIRNGIVYRQYLKSIASRTSPSNFADDVVMITGGTSGLGLETATWLGNHGAQKIALVSRSGHKDETSAVVDAMQQRGIRVKVYAADIADVHSLASLLSSVRQDLGDVTLLVHAAGILEDMPFMSANEVVANKVFTPKLAVSTLVDALKATLKQAIFFSSAASVLGTLAQSIYAGANFYLDQYASLLRNRGIAATSVAWGNIGEIGLAAADSKRGEQLAAKGINTFSKLQFHLLLEQIMGIQKSQVLAIDIDFKRWSSAYSELTQNAYFEAFVPQHIQVVQGEDIYSMANLAAAERSIRKTLKDHISAITKIASTAVKEDVTFKSLGIDSMMAVQLKNKIQDSFKTTIAVANIWAYPTVEKFTKFLVVQLGLEEKYLPKKESPVGATTNNELNVDDMSLEDLMRELEEKSK